MRKRKTHPRGWMLADVVIALAVVAILSTALATSVVKQRQAEQRLAGSRAAARLAEQTLTALQTGTPAPQAPEGTTVEVRRLATAAPVEKTAWVEVTVTRQGRRSDLVGLVRADAPGVTP